MRFFASEPWNGQQIVHSFASREARDRWVAGGARRSVARWREMSASQRRLLNRQLALPLVSEREDRRST